MPKFGMSAEEADDLWTEFGKDGPPEPSQDSEERGFIVPPKPKDYLTFNCKEQDYLDLGITEVNRETFWYMLEVLYPETWEGISSSFELFNMVEYQHGDITSQYVKRRTGDGFYGNVTERYYHKYVRGHDRSTWMTAQSVDEYANKKKNAQSA